MIPLPEFDLSSSEPEVYIPKDKSDPRFLLAHFLYGEIYLKLSNVTEFLEGVQLVLSGKAPYWRWNGNMFTVELDSSKCIITDFEAPLKEQASPEEQSLLSVVELSQEQFVEMLTRWKEYVEEFNLTTY